MRRRNGDVRRRRGLFLIEMVMLLAVMAVVALLAGEIAVTALRVQRAAGDRDARMNRVETALDALRRDAWGATAMRPEAGRVEMEAQGKKVVWIMEGEPNMWVRSEDGAAARRWLEMPAVGFGVKGSVLTVSVDSGGSREEVVMVSERMLVGGGS